MVDTGSWGTRPDQTLTPWEITAQEPRPFPGGTDTQHMDHPPEATPCPSPALLVPSVTWSWGQARQEEQNPEVARLTPMLRQGQGT